MLEKSAVWRASSNIGSSRGAINSSIRSSLLWVKSCRFDSEQNISWTPPHPPVTSKGCRSSFLNSFRELFLLSEAFAVVFLLLRVLVCWFFGLRSEGFRWSSLVEDRGRNGLKSSGNYSAGYRCTIVSFSGEGSSLSEAMKFLLNVAGFSRKRGVSISRLVSSEPALSTLKRGVFSDWRIAFITLLFMP